jgi:DNA adenine methylase
MVPEHGRYFEPFLGGGALVAQVKPHAGVVSDLLPELMALWQMIQCEPQLLADGYRSHWEKLQERGHLYYYEVRDVFNATKNPVAFLFLSRTCVNGLIRFNKNGDFNNSLHHTRPGIHPDRLEPIIQRWSEYVRPLTLEIGDYQSVLSQASDGDFVFLDPPYVGNKGRYLPGTIDFSKFTATLTDLTERGVKWMVTLDGHAGSRDYAGLLPDLGATMSFRVGTGHSPFTRLMKSSLDDISESVHINFEPPLENGALFSHSLSDMSTSVVVSD